MEPTKLILLFEAQNYVNATKDPMMKSFLGLALAGLLHKIVEGDRPAAAFDALFYIQTVEKTFESSDKLSRILLGESFFGKEDGF